MANTVINWWPGKLFPFLVLLQVAGVSAEVSWFPEYEKYKPTHYGKNFILGFPTISATTPLNQVSISALFDANVTITSASSKEPLFTRFVKAGKTVKYDIPETLRIGTRGTHRKGVEIEATDDISVVVLLGGDSETDGFIALPTNALGMKYVVATWNGNGLADFAVISCYDKTTVKVELRMYRGSFNYDGTTYYNGNTITVTLNKLWTSYVFHNYDLSGTIITANKPVAVTSGHIHASVFSNRNQLTSFLVPTKHWGRKFVLPSFWERSSYGDFIRVFASEKNTEVYDKTTRWVTLGRGGYTDKSVNTFNSPFINCSKPCQVIQYLQKRSRTGVYSNAGPSILNLPSIDQFLPSYHVVLLGGSKFKHYIVLVIEDKYKNGVRVNGNPVSYSSTTTQEYIWMIIDIPSEAFVTHTAPGLTFGLFVFGGSDTGISYAYPGGFTFQRESKACKRKVDLGFALDSSGSVSTSNYEKMKTFVKDLTNFFTISHDDTRVSVMSFASQARIHIPFSRYFDDNQELAAAIDAIDYSGGGTATALALNMAYQDMFQEKNGARKSGATRVLIILTDGQSNGGVEAPAERLKNAGVVIFSVGIGQNINMGELHSMASQPKEQRVILLENFHELSTLAKKMSSTTCNVSSFAVTCEKDWMGLTYERSSLPRYVNVDELALKDRSCKATHNKTHIIAKTNLNHCGTSYRETEQEMIYSNDLTTGNLPADGSIITRDKEISLKFTCTYGRLRTVGSFNFLPAKQKLTITEKNVGNFTFKMNFYKDTSYEQRYGDDDYPVSKSLSDQIYVQYSVDSSNSDVVIRAKTCRATPTNKPYDKPQYVFIDEGCDKDGTIVHHTSGLQKRHRFSIQAFAFVINHRYVYFHCDLVLCNSNTPNSICTKSTTCPSRRRRDVGPADDNLYQLSTGPIIYREREDKTDPKGKSLASGSYGLVIGSLSGVAVLSLVLISIFVVLTVKQRRATYEASSNVQVLSMENIVDIKD